MGNVYGSTTRFQSFSHAWSDSSSMSWGSKLSGSFFFGSSSESRGDSKSNCLCNPSFQALTFDGSLSRGSYQTPLK